MIDVAGGNASSYNHLEKNVGLPQPGVDVL